MANRKIKPNDFVLFQGVEFVVYWQPHDLKLLLLRSGDKHQVMLRHCPTGYKLVYSNMGLKTKVHKPSEFEVVYRPGTAQKVKKKMDRMRKLEKFVNMYLYDSRTVRQKKAIARELLREGRK